MTYIRTCPRCGRVYKTPADLDRHWEKEGNQEKQASPLVSRFGRNGKPFEVRVLG